MSKTIEQIIKSFNERFEDDCSCQLFEVIAEVNDYLTKELTQFQKDCRQEVIEEIKTLITDEIAIAHLEGTPTARLTSLFNRLN